MRASTTGQPLPDDPQPGIPDIHIPDIQEQVRRRYAAAARAASPEQTGSAEQAGCCGPAAEADGPTATAGTAGTCCGDEPAGFGVDGYPAGELADLPQAARTASLGCGNPFAVADLHEGETVLDLGSGGGGDVLLSARRVGPSGWVYGLDMTDEMLQLARRNAAEAGADNVEFRNGRIEQLPLPDASVDVVISNCVINLSPDKPAVFAEAFRVLRPGGRIGVADLVAEDRLTPAERAERGSWVGCVAGALSHGEYLAGLRAAGFEDVEVTTTHQPMDGIDSAVIRAVRP